MESVTYRTSLDGISDAMLNDFCVGWINPLSGEKLYKVLKNSQQFVLAMGEDKVVGFVNALSDGVHFAFIPMLEVLPKHQKRGIGKRLLSLLIEQLKDIPIIDLMCDLDMQDYYEPLGFTKMHGMRYKKL